MSITALPQPPTRSDPVNFNSRADAFLSALPTFATEANELQVDVNAKQTAAAASASNAAAAELAANAAANVTAWVSGTTYAVGNVRYSPITFLSYRRKTAGAGTTDPSADSTNWQLINGTGNVNLDGTQTLTNKTFGSGCTWDGNVIPVAEGGTGATTAANARSNLDVPSTSGANATGTWNISISGNAATVTTLNTSQVNSAVAGSAVGAVGTYVMAQFSGASTAAITFGSTTAGSNLQPVGAFTSTSGNSTANSGTGSALSGTWRCMGHKYAYVDGAPGFATNAVGTLWLRIA